ncbi:Matrix metalloproteinase-15 [Nymphaea thermarum]|nr:Matrix metalloproteinase-15 [Nymphaea thermarum]
MVVAVDVTVVFSLSLYSVSDRGWVVVEGRLRSSGSKSDSKSNLRPVFREAFETWALSSPFDFTETSNDRIAQLHIGFYGEGHLDCPLFGDLLAHASYPPYGMLHINADYVWEIDLEILLNTEESYDVQSVTLHEIGHLLGLGHSTVPEAIMYPTLDSQTRKVELHDDDIAGMNAMFEDGFRSKGTISTDLFPERDRVLAEFLPKTIQRAPFLQMPKMVSTLSFVAILMFLVQTNCMEWASGHNGDFHYQAGAEFLQLSGYGKGQSHEVLPSLKRYLQHFGYLDTVADTGFSCVFDEDLEAAVQKYQAFFSLNATGVLDTATVHQLIQPRCGVPDIIKDPVPAKFHQINVTGNSSASLYRSTTKRWPPSSRSLLYNILENEHLPFPIEELRPVFREAFETWALSSPFDFTETSTDRIAQLHIGFYRGRHVNCPPFDDLLAHANYPPHGAVHINADIVWAIDPEILKNTEESYDLQSVVLHEIGHLLGLAHSSIPEAIMCPDLDSQTRMVELHSDDIAGINAMYPRSS